MTDFKEVCEMVLAHAADARMDAGYGGRYDDGGASHMEELVKFFNHGLKGELPPEWEKYLDKNHPNYTRYLRMKIEYKAKAKAKANG